MNYKMIINPIRPHYITIENWNKMTRKEQDYIFLLRKERYTQEELKRALYIETDQWLWKLNKRVRKFINWV